MKTLTLRLPDALHEALRRLAQQQHRSLHAQILVALEHALTDTLDPPADPARMDPP